MKIIIFGKKGCKKCAILKDRLNKFLAQPEYISIFILENHELTDEESIIKFCDLECLNFSRIPAFYIEDNGKPLKSKIFSTFSLTTILGLQTDYEKGGTMTPKMLQQVLDEAKEQGTVNERLVEC